MAIRLAASSDLLYTASPPPSGDVTACFWMRQVTIRGAGAYTLLWGMGSNTSTASDAYALYMNFSGGLELYGPPGTLILTTGTVSASQAYFLALVGNTGASQAWAVVVNGTTTTGTSPAGGGYNPSSRVDLGACLNNSAAFSNASYAAYKHWNAQLTADEVQAERWSYLPQRWGTLWSCAPLLQTGNLSDLSGQGSGFTATGSVATEDGPPIAWRPRQARTWGQVAAAAAGAGILRQMLQHAG